jgi:hypothetical protein
MDLQRLTVHRHGIFKKVSFSVNDSESVTPYMTDINTFPTLQYPNISMPSTISPTVKPDPKSFHPCAQCDLG